MLIPRLPSRWQIMALVLGVLPSACGQPPQPIAPSAPGVATPQGHPDVRHDMEAPTVFRRQSSRNRRDPNGNQRTTAGHRPERRRDRHSRPPQEL